MGKSVESGAHEGENGKRIAGMRIHEQESALGQGDGEQSPMVSCQSATVKPQDSEGILATGIFKQVFISHRWVLCHSQSPKTWQRGAGDGCRHAVVAVTSPRGEACRSRKSAPRHYAALLATSFALKSLPEKPEKKQQVPPLRYAPVGMTILWDGKASKAVKRMAGNGPTAIVIPTGAKRSGGTCCFFLSIRSDGS